MSSGWHSSVPPELRELCEAACRNPRTGEIYHRQIDALKLKSHDYSARRIARVFGITDKAVRDLLERAALNVQKEKAARGGYGNGGVL